MKKIIVTLLMMISSITSFNSYAKSVENINSSDAKSLYSFLAKYGAVEYGNSYRDANGSENVINKVGYLVLDVQTERLVFNATLESRPKIIVNSDLLKISDIVAKYDLLKTTSEVEAYVYISCRFSVKRYRDNLDHALTTYSCNLKDSIE